MTARDIPIASKTNDREYLCYLLNTIALITLALSFIVGTMALHGLRDHIATFHGSDEELFHYPIILKFAETLPQNDTLGLQFRNNTLVSCFLFSNCPIAQDSDNKRNAESIQRSPRRSLCGGLLAPQHLRRDPRTFD